MIKKGHLLHQGVRNILLASLDDMEETGYFPASLGVWNSACSFILTLDTMDSKNNNVVVGVEDQPDADVIKNVQRHIAKLL